MKYPNTTTSYVVALGDAFNGLQLYGPFVTREEAVEWSAVNAPMRGVIAEMLPPKYEVVL
jgi:hypothetical protein